MEPYRLVRQLVSAMSVMHEQHDHHGPQTATLARRLAEAAGLPEAHAALIEVGAHLHDIGKLMLPRELLNAPRKLGPDELELVRTHTTIGWALVDQAGFEPAIGEIVRHHHERYDGNGYPDGLAADQIPPAARLVAICDVYAALVSPRSYRQAYTPAFARSYMQAGKGTFFDPHLVDLFFGAAVPDVPETAHG